MLLNIKHITWEIYVIKKIYYIFEHIQRVVELGGSKIYIIKLFHFWRTELLQNMILNFAYIHQTSKMSKIWKKYLKFDGNTLTLFVTQNNITRTMCEQGLPQENTMSIIFLIFVNRV